MYYVSYLCHIKVNCYTRVVSHTVIWWEYYKIRFYLDYILYFAYYTLRPADCITLLYKLYFKVKYWQTHHQKRFCLTTRFSWTADLIMLYATARGLKGLCNFSSSSNPSAYHIFFFLFVSSLKYFLLLISVNSPFLSCDLSSFY